MSTSGTNDTFTMVGNEIYAAAFNLLGVGSEGEALTARMYADAQRSANLLIKSWSAMEHLWMREQASLTLVAGQAAYVLPDKPMRVLAARRKITIGGYEVPLTAWSRQEYLDQPNKTSSTSTPVNFYYDPQRVDGTLYLWPAPSSQVAPTCTIEYDYLRRMDDMLSSNDEAQIPVEWLEPLIYNLAVRLMPQYPVNDGNLSGLVIAQAKEMFANLNGWDNEPTSLYLQPDYYGSGGFGYNGRF